MIKIAIVGPESTGKSFISEKLANAYKTVYVPEYARTYCSQLTSPCTWQDEINMFHGQLKLEEEIRPQANEILFCDTMFLTVKIWCEKVFGKCPQEVLEHLPKHPYDFYLLMNIDLPWQYDPLRDFPNEREYFLEVWKKELNQLNAPFELISGIGETRTENALQAVEAFLASKKLP